MKSDDSIMYAFYCIVFIAYMIPRQILLDYVNLFSPNDCQKNEKIIYKYLNM